MLASSLVAADMAQLYRLVMGNASSIPILAFRGWFVCQGLSKGRMLEGQVSAPGLVTVTQQCVLFVQLLVLVQNPGVQLHVGLM